MLNKEELKTDIVSLVVDLKSRDDNSEQALQDFAEGLSDAIDKFIRGATIQASQANIASAAMSNGGGPVVAAGVLFSTIS